MPETNYEPDIFGNPGSATVICIFGNCSGSGTPASSLGEDGFSYVDEDTGTLWIKSGGSWSIVTGGSGVTQVFRSTADPSGNPGVSVAIHYRTDTGGVWIWNGSSWDQIIG